VHVLPPVEVIRTVVAVTEPVLLAGPNALTQSPTATAEDVVVCVSDKVVDFPVVILSFWVLGFVVFDDFVLVERLKAWLNRVPDKVTVEPLTAVTLPEEIEKFAVPGNDPRPPLVRPGKVPRGGVSPDPVEPVPPNLPPAPPPPAPPNRPPAPAPPPSPVVQVPAVDGLLIVMERAAIVVFDFFDGVPVTVKQSPTATALMVSVAVSENVVVAVQVTAVCAVVLCTSIVLPVMVATLPLVTLPLAVAAPAADVRASTNDRQPSAAPVAIPILRSLRLLRDALAIVVVVSPVEIPCAIYSLLSASIGAKWAARLAG
jgi:hypothetical protein